MKKIALSSALAALIAIPALGIEVYSNEEKDASVSLYGSLRGFVGGGGEFPKINDGKADGSGKALIGFQNNSHFGIDSKYGKLFTKVEFGLNEAGFLTAGSGPGLRKVFGTYDFGAGGKLTFGKLDTPTIESGFQSDFNNNDAGGNGFGSVTTGSRKLQIQYAHSGATVAIIADEAAAGNATNTAYFQSYAANAKLNAFPRIAVSYEGKIGEKGKFKVAATYKYYGESAKVKVGGAETETNLHAGHLFAGAKIPFGEKAYLSAIFNYGINGHLYGEQITGISQGGYGFTDVTTLADGAFVGGIGNGLYTSIGNNGNPTNTTNWYFTNAQRAGLLLEGGAKINDTISIAAGAGYQATFNGIGQRGNAYNLGLQAIHSYKVYANLPINVAKGFQVVPQIAFYDTVFTGKHIADYHQAALVGLIRLKYDF